MARSVLVLSHHLLHPGLNEAIGRGDVPRFHRTRQWLQQSSGILIQALDAVAYLTFFDIFGQILSHSGAKVIPR